MAEPADITMREEEDNDETFIKQESWAQLASLRAEARRHYTDARARGEEFPDMTAYRAVWKGVLKPQDVAPTAPTAPTMFIPRRKESWTQTITPLFDAKTENNYQQFMYGQVTLRRGASIRATSTAYAWRKPTLARTCAWQSDPLEFIVRPLIVRPLEEQFTLCHSTL